MVNGLIGKKIDQSQAFLEDGTRVPVTRVVCDNVVVLFKQKDKDGYDAVQLGAGTRKRATKAQLGQARGAKLKIAPQFLKEVRLADSDFPQEGSYLKASEVFKSGDVIDVIGVSKGKGYAGVVKRHHFKGGPRTHGQSDRERAPGSIGQTTTPGRVYKGKRMAGRMGTDNVTIKNLSVLYVENNDLWIKGLIPGVRGGFVVIEKARSAGAPGSGKMGGLKKFIPLYKENQEETTPEVQTQPQERATESQEQPAETVQAQPQVQPQEKKQEVTEEGGEGN